jgi:hypothetical protein
MVISFMKDPIHFGLGSPITWLRIVAIAAADCHALGSVAHVRRLIAAAVSAEGIDEKLAGQAIARRVRTVEDSSRLTRANAIRIAACRLKVQDRERVDEILVVRVSHRRRPTEVGAVQIRGAEHQLDAFVRHFANRKELA